MNLFINEFSCIIVTMRSGGKCIRELNSKGILKEGNIERGEINVCVISVLRSNFILIHGIDPTWTVYCMHSVVLSSLDYPEWSWPSTYYITNVACQDHSGGNSLNQILLVKLLFYSALLVTCREVIKLSLPISITSRC